MDLTTVVASIFQTGNTLSDVLCVHVRNLEYHMMFDSFLSLNPEKSPANSKKVNLNAKKN